MLYEIRTYDLVMGGVAEFEENTRRALPHREKYSKLTAFFHTEIGNLHQMVHIWAYDDLNQRIRVREVASKDPHWPPPNNHLIERQYTEIMLPAPFMRPIEPGHYGNIYEMRIYTCKPGSMPEILRRWGEMMPRRERYSPCLACGYTELGSLNRLIHIWPYDDLNQRARVRREAAEKGDWPPDTMEFFVKMENKILIPSDFSPVR